MPTLLDAADRDAIISRLRTINEGTPGRWGTFSAPRMLCHITDQLRVALGDIPSTDRSTLLGRTVMKWVVVESGLKAPPGRVHTVREMLVSAPGAWTEDIAGCEQCIQRVGSGAATAVHPTFGPLTPAEWGRLCWKHLDHHLRQFGA